MRSRTLHCAALAIALLTAGGAQHAPALPASGSEDEGSRADSEGSVINVWGERGESSGGRAATAGTPAPHYITQRFPQRFCGTLDTPSLPGAACIDDTISGTVVRVCTEGSTALDALYRRELNGSGSPTGPWVQIDRGGCPEDPVAATVLTAVDFARLPLSASAPRLQPADGHGLVGMDLVVYTDPTQQTLTTIVLGVPVVVRAVPTRYAWDFGDGTPPLVTTDPGHPYPGHPYPEHTTARAYASAGTYQLTLTTTWSGTYQVAGAGPWFPVLGTAVTTSAPLTTYAHTADSVLVAETLPDERLP